MTRRIYLAFGALTAMAALAPLTQAHAGTCESLVGQKVGGGTVISAERMASGQKLSLAGAAALFPIPPAKAAFCRVKARISPVPQSEIDVEVWLPETWNGKFVGTGGGGFSGGLEIAALTLNPIVAKGYAAATTNVGHPAGDSAKWAYKQPEKLVDWAHRGNHVTAQFSKALIAAYYAKPAERAYFQGCSNGGRDALMEAWRYPEDYDAIVAGAPAAPWTRDFTAMPWNIRALDGPPAVNFSPAKLKLVNDAVMARCDKLDGVQDGVLENPLACRFDPKELQCKANATSDCLSGAEVKALRALYQGPRTRDGRQISTGLAVGGETVEWEGWITGPKAVHRQMSPEFFRWMVYGDETWSIDRFDLERDYAEAVNRVGSIVDSDNPDIRPFLKRGGKLLIYHGWADAALPPGNTINYYNAVRSKAGAKADQVRLFMVPGMAHCAKGPGPSLVDWLGALDTWAQDNKPPERILASKPEDFNAAFMGQPTKTLRTRPLCAWPAVARWNGKGSTDEAANFRCVASK